MSSQSKTYMQNSTTNPIVLLLACVGLIYVLAITFSYFRLVFSLFVLSGSSVSQLSEDTNSILTDRLLSYGSTDGKGHGRSSVVLRMELAKNSPCNLPKKASTWCSYHVRRANWNS